MTTASRTSQYQVQKLGNELSERDWEVIRFIKRHRFATTNQIRRCFFNAHATQSAATRACVRVLDRLLTKRLVTRLERRVGGVRHGSAAFVWCLDVVGDRLTSVKGSPRRRVQEPSYPFLAHTLAVAETHVQIWEAAHGGAFHLRDVEVETEAWREYVAMGGVKTILKPDLRVAIGSKSFDDHWYLEVDRGTESLPVLLRKSLAYDAYRRTGRAQAEHGVFPRVLWLLPDTGRVERLREAIDAESRLLDRLFVCITRDALMPTLANPP